MFTPLHSVIDREEHEKYLFIFLQLKVSLQILATIWTYGRFTCDSMQSMNHRKKAKGQSRFIFSVV